MSSTRSGSVKPRSAPTWWTPRKFSQSDGPIVADFGATFMHISKGRVAGGPFLVTPWQAELLGSVFERREDGLLRFRRVLIGLGRKNGKSLLGSLIALYGLIEGEPGAEVYSAAGDRKQARIVFDEARWQVQQSPALSGVCKVYRDAIEVPATHSVYRVLSSDAKLQQGLNPSTVVFDELHVQPNSELWDALSLGSGARRDPQIVALTTAGYDLSSLCAQMYRYGRSVVTGEVVDDAFGFFWWEAPEGCGLDDREAWRAANPNLELGLLSEEDMEVARRQTQEIAFRRYRLNQWVRTNVESWLPAGAWDACRSELDLEDGLPVWVGVDVALKRDSTAVVVVQPQGERLVARAKVWHPDLVTMDLAGVEQYLRELHARFEVREIAFDPAFFQRSAEALADDGLPMVEFAQSPQRMVPAIATTYDMIVNQVVAHSGDPMFADQVLSAAPRSTDSGIRLSKGKSRRKIDAAIALVMAVDRATRKAEPAPSPGFFVI